MTLDIGKSYDAVAADYATEFRDELSKKPFDRKMLDWLIEKVGDAGVICDIGCGPGHIANYLKSRGAETFGVDLSLEMVKQARHLNPEIRFEQADMLKIDTIESESLGGIVAFYSLIHLPRNLVVDALKEFKRLLRNTGSLIVAHHIGTELIHRDEWFGKQVSVDFQFFETEEMKNYIQQSGLALEEVIEREPYQAEYPSRRAYIFARKSDNPKA